MIISRSSMLLKMALFHYSLWLRTIPHLYLVICQRTFRLLPCLGYYKPPMFNIKRAQGLKSVPKSGEVIGNKSFASQVVLLKPHCSGLKVTTGSFFGERTRVLGLFNKGEKFIRWNERMWGFSLICASVGPFLWEESRVHWKADEKDPVELRGWLCNKGGIIHSESIPRRRVKTGTKPQARGRFSAATGGQGDKMMQMNEQMRKFSCHGFCFLCKIGNGVWVVALEMAPSDASWRSCPCVTPP